PNPADRAVESYRRLADVFHDVLAEESLDAVLDRIAATLSELVPYDALTIYQADEAQQQLVPVLSRDKWAGEIMKTRVGFDQGITGWAASRREPVLANQAHLDPRVGIIPGTPVAVLMLDLDDFKRINDVHGHGIGDELLRLLADALRGAVRNGDVVCRLGGEEFAVIMEQASRDRALRLAERLVERVASVDYPP